MTYKDKTAATKAAIKHFGDLLAMHEAGYSISETLQGKWVIAC